MKPKVIVFDLDGTIFDSEGIGIEQMCKLYLGFNLEIHKEILYGNLFESMKENKFNLVKIPETEEEIKKREVVYAENKSKCLAYVGMLELLGELHKAGYILALNTSAREYSCMPLIKQNGLDKIFDFLGTKEVSQSKVEKFKMMIDKYDVRPEEMLFVTDTVGDIKEAKVVAVPTIAVTWGIHDRAYFTREPHENLIGIVDTVSKLREKILGK